MYDDVEALTDEEEQELRRLLDPIRALRMPPDFLEQVLAETEVLSELPEQNLPKETTPASSRVIPFPETHKQFNWWKAASYAQAAIIVLTCLWIATQVVDSSWLILSRRGNGSVTQLITQGDHYAQEGHYAQAQERYEQYIQRDTITGKQIGVVLRRLAAVQYRSSHYQNAYEAASAAVLLDPLDACAYWYRGASAYMLHRAAGQDNVARAQANWLQAQSLGDTEATRSLQELQASQKGGTQSIYPQRQTPCEYLP